MICYAYECMGIRVCECDCDCVRLYVLMKAVFETVCELLSWLYKCITHATRCVLNFNSFYPLKLDQKQKICLEFSCGLVFYLEFWPKEIYFLIPTTEKKYYIHKKSRKCSVHIKMFGSYEKKLCLCKKVKTILIYV